MSGKTTVVNLRTASFDVDISRATKWGNPFTHLRDQRTRALYVVATREEAIAKYEEWVKQQSHLMAALPRLKGKRLGCYCKPLSCHGDILARLADEVPNVEA